MSCYCLLYINKMLKSLIEQALCRKEESNKTAHTIIIRKQHLPIQESQTVQLNTQPKRPKFRIHPRSKSQQKSKETARNLADNHINSRPCENNAVRTPRSKNLIRKRESKSTPLQNKSSVETKKQLVKSEERSSLESYLEYIRASPTQHYRMKIDFESLRARGQRSGIANSQKQALWLLKSIFDSFYQHLSGLPSPADQAVQDCCFLYLYSQDKHMLQIFLSRKYPPILHSKLRPYLVYQRILVYSLLTLTKTHSLQKMTLSQIESFKLIIKYTNDCLQVLAEPLLKIEREVVKKIEETFMKLKAVGQMEKKLGVIERQMQRVYEIHQDTSRYRISGKAQWTLERLAQREMELSWKFFKIPPLPYLPERPRKPFTLVIQLDNTLIFYEKATKTLKYRPYVDVFITKIMNYFEIVLFSSLPYEYTKTIVNKIEKIGRYFDFCLCEGHMVPRVGKLVKDYGRLGRDEKRVMIVDYVCPAQKRWVKNFLPLTFWEGDKTDRQLEKLSHALEELQAWGCDDVRENLKRLNKGMQKTTNQMIVEQEEL